MTGLIESREGKHTRSTAFCRTAARNDIRIYCVSSIVFIYTNWGLEVTEMQIRVFWFPYLPHNNNYSCLTSQCDEVPAAGQPSRPTPSVSRSSPTNLITKRQTLIRPCTLSHRETKLDDHNDPIINAKAEVKFTCLDTNTEIKSHVSKLTNYIFDSLELFDFQWYSSPTLHRREVCRAQFLYHGLEREKSLACCYIISIRSPYRLRPGQQTTVGFPPLSVLELQK